ncbi:hypothetical protein Z3_106 [Bacillus phage Z3]|nr:hypothetical protein BCVP_CDS0115 [Bacillus phage BC-VP]WQZ49422.1 hypothetical protein Z3_106 [Bacillus phage Z3]
MADKFKIIWNASTPIGTPATSQGTCSLCNRHISNYQNHYATKDEESRVCLTCASELSKSYEEVFNNNQPKGEK